METVLRLEQEPPLDGLDGLISEYGRRIDDWKLEVEVGYQGAGGEDRRVVKLEESGTQTTTRGFSDWLSGLASRRVEGVDFLIGGKEGFPAELDVKVDWEWSLSSLTLNQGVAALVVAEQLYRCWAIRHDHPYH